MKYKLQYAGKRLEALDVIRVSGAKLERDSIVSFQSTRQLEYCLLNGIKLVRTYTSFYPLVQLSWGEKNEN